MKNRAPRFVMLHGVAGAGKSTLAEGLSSALLGQGAEVDLIPEEAIFTRDEFVEVGRGFKTGVWPTAEVMLAAYQRVLEAVRRENRWVIADWNCVGMIEDLPCAQPDRATLTTFQHEARADMDVLVAHARDVHILAADLHPILLVLRVPIRVAVTRAATERGQEWIDRYATPVQELYGGEPLIERVVRGYEGNIPHDKDILSAYTKTDWEVVELDAYRPRAGVLHEALRLL